MLRTTCCLLCRRLHLSKDDGPLDSNPPWSLGTGPGPGSFGLGPWAMVHGPWPLGLGPGPWALALVPEPWALDLGPWALGRFGPWALALRPWALGFGPYALILSQSASFIQLPDGDNPRCPQYFAIRILDAGFVILDFAALDFGLWDPGFWILGFFILGLAIRVLDPGPGSWFVFHGLCGLPSRWTHM